MLKLIIQCFYFMLPAYLANMAPVIVKKIPFLTGPIDNGKTFQGKPLFGSHKTYRGFIFGIVFAVIVSYVQFLLSPYLKAVSIIDYSNWLNAGFLLGFGAMAGDLAKSFIKRRFGIQPGQPFIPWDQLDFVFGAIVFVYPLVPLNATKMSLIILISLVGHILVNHSAFYLGIRKEKW